MGGPFHSLSLAPFHGWPLSLWVAPFTMGGPFHFGNSMGGPFHVGNSMGGPFHVTAARPTRVPKRELGNQGSLGTRRNGVV